MDAPFDLPELPEGTRLVCTPRAALALDPSAAELLDQAGYGPESDGERHAADVSGRRPLVEFHAGGRRFLVRRFVHGGLLRFATGERFADPARPFLELAASHRLRRAGVATPPVVAARARRAGGPGWQLEVVTERVEGARDGAQLIDARRAGTASEEAWRAALEAAGRLVRDLWSAGFDHPDLQPANVLLADDGAALVLDLDRGTFPDELGPDRRGRMLARFDRWVELRERRRGRAVTDRDRVRFLRAVEPERAARRALAATVLRRREGTRGRHGLGHALERVLGLARER